LVPDFGVICDRIKSSAKLAGKTAIYFGAEISASITDETRNIVASVYPEDIELFGYSFDNSSLPAQNAARDKMPLAAMA
jgi:hypothetical protein